MEESVVIVTEVRRSNGLGVAGFVLALLGIFFSWVPVLGWIIWVLGLVFSFIAVFRKPRGLAIAGLVLSLIDLIVLIAFVGMISSMF